MHMPGRQQLAEQKDDKKCV